MKLSSVENLNDEQLLEIYEDILDYNERIVGLNYDFNTTCYGLCNCTNGTSGYGTWTWPWWQDEFYSGNYVYLGGYWDLCSYPNPQFNAPCRNMSASYVYLVDCRKVKK